MQGRRRSTFAAMLVVLGLIGLVLAGSWFSTSSERQPVAAVRGDVVAYGSAPSAFGQLWVPSSVDGSRAPVVVIIHGGFWQRRVADLSIMTPMAEALFEQGYAVWNVEYGRVGEREGGWPHTFAHVGDAVDHLDDLAAEYAIDTADAAVVGHSAGGQLAVWVGGRLALEAGDPGASPQVIPTTIVALAPVLNLELADAEGLGNGAVANLLGGTPAEVPERYRVAGVGRDFPGLTVVVGSDDRTVPERFAVDGDVMRWPPRSVPAADHFDLIDVEDPTFELILDLLRSQ